MAKARTPRTPKAKVENKVLQMPETGTGNNNGHANHLASSDVEAEIRQRAYELYAQRGYANGDPDRDWLEAEREVLARHGNREHTA
jgi:Protein of unknown function (DUF2934)